MTDYTKLIERLREVEFGKAADAIEALQAEVAEHKENAIRNARIAVSIRTERDQLQSKLGDAIQSSARWQHQFTEAQAENERLTTRLKMTSDTMNGYNLQRAALEAKLDELQRQKPIGFVIKDSDYTNSIIHEQGGHYTQPVYAAPKALAPRFTECRIELVGAIHTLASHYENRLGRLDPEDRKLAEGDIAHAMATVAKWNWNGNGIGGTP